MAKITPLNTKARQLFQNSTENLLDLLDSFPVCISYFDKEQKYQFNNKKYEEWFGISLNEIQGKHVREVLGEKTYESISGHIEKALDGDEALYDAELINKNGTTRFVQVNLIPHVNDKGDVEGCYAYVRDISESVRMSDELQKKLRFEELISKLSARFVNLPASEVDRNINDGLQLVNELVDVDEIFILQFQGGQEKAGVTHGCFKSGKVRELEFRASEFLQVFPWAGRKILENEAVVFEKMDEELPAEAVNEREYLRKIGLESAVVIPLFAGKNNIGAFFVQTLGREKTWSREVVHQLRLVGELFSSALERKKTASILAESQDRLRAFMDNSPAFMYIKDKSLKHIYANRSLLEYFNITLDEFIGTDAHDFLPENIAVNLEEYDRQVIEKGVPVETDEFRFAPRDELLCIKEIKFPIKLYSGEVGVGGIVMDITALKLAEQSLTEQLQFERLIADISARLAQTKPAEFEEVLNWTLSALGQFLRTERSFLAQFSEDYSRMLFTNLWAADGIDIASSIFETDLASEVPSIVQHIRNGAILIAGPGLTGIPDELRFRLERDGINSGIVVPICVEGKPIGMLGLDTVCNAREYPQAIVDRLRIVADMIGTTLHRIRAGQMLDEQLKFEDLLSRLSATFIHIKAADVDKNIEHALQLIAEFLDVQRANLFQFSHNQDSLTLTHSWAEEGVKTSPRTVFSDQHPWFTKKLIRKESFCFSNPADLPKEAKVEKEYLIQQGIKSAFIFPLVAAGESHGCVTLSSMKRERQWPDKLKTQLALAAEIFSNALLRKRADEKISENLMEIKQLKDRLEQENIYLRDQISLQSTHKNIIGMSDAIKYVLYKIRQVAPSDTTVLILGETGTGKELVSEAIHGASSRSKQSLVKVNCAALPANLIESELFGREKGAFTGSMAKQIGRFELADKGTIFLDEVGELPLELQAKLLRVIQSGEFERLGSPHTISVDVRVIASTNRDLINEVKQGRFREDLYYRLNVFPITVPPLRDRTEDIPLLVKFFLGKFEKKMGKKIEKVPYEVIKSLQGYHWPGNVRELENVIERSMIITPGSALKLADKLETSVTTGPELSHRKSLTEVERDHIFRALEQTRWKIEGKNGAAESLEINPSTLRTRMRKLGIVKPKEQN